MRRLNPLHDEGTKDIDISPLIDVVFILLIFFMVSTTFVKDAALDIERPGAQSASPAPAHPLRPAPAVASRLICGPASRPAKQPPP